MLIIDDGQVRVESAADCAGDDLPGDRKPSCDRVLARTFGSPRSVPRARTAVRYATISHDGRHAGRGGSGAVLGAKNIKAIAVRGTQRPEWAHPRELTAHQQGPVEAIVRSGDGEIPRAWHRHQSADVQPLRRAADAQLPERHVRRSGEPLARAAEHHAREDPRQLRDVHDRLRAYLLDRRAGAGGKCASSTRACSRLDRCAASAMPTSCCAHRSDATSSASTPSAPAGRSRLRWSASSAAGSMSRG